MAHLAEAFQNPIINYVLWTIIILGVIAGLYVIGEIITNWRD
jgi:hypothetical protein